MTTKKAAIIVETRQGVGHMRRAAAMARGLENNGFEVHIITSQYSHDKGRTFDYGNAKFAQYLPSYVRNPETGITNMPPGAHTEESFHALRRENIIDALEDIKPDTVIVESWPFGRGRLDTEFMPAIEHVKQARPDTKIFSLIREVMLFSDGRSEPNADKKVVDIINKNFDGVISTSDPNFFKLGDTFPYSHAIRKPIIYPGFFVTKALPREPVDDVLQREVIVSAGGGYTANSAMLFEGAIKAKNSSEFKDHPWTLFVSNECPLEEFNRLTELAKTHSDGSGSITVQRFSGDFQKRMANATAIISEVGQTMAEAVDVKTTGYQDNGLDPVTIIAAPRYNPNNPSAQEQMFKAQRYQELGLVSIAEPKDMADPEVFASIINGEKQRAETFAQAPWIDGIKVDAGAAAGEVIDRFLNGHSRHSRKSDIYVA